MGKNNKNPMIKYLSSYKWANPNKFNANDAILADIVALAGFFILQLAIGPLIILLKNIGVTIGPLMCLSAFLTQGLIFFIAFTFCKISGVRIFSGGINFRWDFSACLPALALSIGTFLVIMPVHMTFVEDIAEVQRSIFGWSSIDNTEIPITPIDMPFMLIYIYILTPLLPAICEEVLFRGVVMNGLREKGTIVAIFMSGMLFALMHGSYMQFVLQFIIGCEIAFAVITTNNYFIGSVMHFANNLFSSIFTVVINSAMLISPAIGYLADAFSIIIGIALCIFAILYYIKLYNFKKLPKFDFWGRPVNRKFLFYKEEMENGYCCLLQKGFSEGNCFYAGINVVKRTDNSNMLYFYNGKFRKFTKKSDNTLFYILTGCAFVLSFAFIILDFII